MKLNRLVTLVVATLAFAVAPLAQASSEHKPGDPGHSVTLDADVDHPCAGRKLLYHSHNDALYGTRSGGKLAVMAVDGQQVTSQDSVCFRLAPDADADGNDLSKLTIPDDGTLDFLGPRGSEVWAAPQSVDWTDNWRPIWSGLGAFDPAHELDPTSIPTNFNDGVMHFDLVDMEGPGDINVMFTSRVYEPERLFDSSNPDMRTITYEVGGHGHFTWTFSKPGIYALTWQGRAERTDGTTERSEPITQYWLVGDDATVGLPEGTTTGLRTPKSASTPTDAQPTTSATITVATTAPTSPKASTSAQPTTAPTLAPTPTSPKASTSSSTSAQPTSTQPKPAPGTSTPNAAAKERALIKAGHMDMALVGEGSSLSTVLIDDSDPLHPAHRPSGSFIFAVPDSARTDLPDSVRDSFPGSPAQMWILPQAQDKNLPWLGFSTTGVPASAIEEGSRITVSMRDVTGPGRLMTWHEDLRGLRIELDSGDPSKTLQYPVNAHDHQGFGFTEPGIYTATFVYSGTTRDGEAFEKELVATFAVGDDAITNAPTNPDDTDSAGSTGNAGKSLNVPQALAAGLRQVEKELKKFGDAIAPAAKPSTKPSAQATTQRATRPTTRPSNQATSRPSRTAAPAAPATTAQSAQSAQSARSVSTARAAQAAPRSQAAAQSSAKQSPTRRAQASRAASSQLSTSTSAPATTSAPSPEPSPESASDASGSGIHAAQPVEGTSNSATAGGFWAGLAIGVGIMALIGGAVLFVAALKLLRRAERHDEH
ncbi:choice-of-anchor M domain-containing protein [Corynebacterium coyleae]|uniref:choice-of-anchor M domain-containing protein n=1 Tax=Corynebacterium coyleae TaxID=53374 RepID=UPI00254AB4F1|nr:choice-of-anchor M domain-containing protein [Corynebacterium coyleae]MDK8663783.1 choice-of-anchor M domain-containing protein [Corynebacterium coyleae]MDK8706676.1 choice-of-anchor M domain-containing protein [Corynebacterium coyleae]MDK8733585.1 choice-of-anchor M domain-containing protein [Corynebacterium coyleae]MDK8892781.1 choice-of-anchor M domain-containing protein [Corynebacterium coyleae]